MFKCESTISNLYRGSCNQFIVLNIFNDCAKLLGRNLRAHQALFAVLVLFCNYANMNCVRPISALVFPMGLSENGQAGLKQIDVDISSLSYLSV